MRSTDHEYLKKSEKKLDHHEDVSNWRSPWTRGRALDKNIDIGQLKVANYHNLVANNSGGTNVFYFVLGYSRLDGPDVLR